MVVVFNGPIPDTHVSQPPNQGVEKSPFQISVKRLEVDENVFRTHFRIGLNWPVFFLFYTFDTAPTIVKKL